MKILTTADWHFRFTVPTCMDMTEKEWMDIQKEALKQVEEIAVEKNVSAIFVGGDLFHKDSVASFECIYMLQQFVQRMYSEHNIRVYILCGNHDIRNHSSESIPKSAIGLLLNSKWVLNMSDKDSFVKGCNFDQDDYDGYEYIFKHTLCIPIEEKNDFIDCETPQSLLERYRDARYVFTGDYHKNFVYKSDDNRFVINSGCLTKQASDFEDYQCGVYFTDTDNDNIVWCPINIDYKFNHNGQIKKEIDENIEKFATGIKKESITLDFITSLKNELPNHEQPVQDKVNEWIGQIGQ